MKISLLRKYLCGIFVFLLLTTLITCKKKSDKDPVNSNEFKAIIIRAPGDTIKINATGFNASFCCCIIGGGTILKGADEANNVIYAKTAGCISDPGTYNFGCEFGVSNAGFYNAIGTNKGSITFTAISADYIEGYFNAVSKCFWGSCNINVDSVIITGSFKGNTIRGN